MQLAKSTDFAWKLARESIALIGCALVLAAGLLWAFPFEEKLRSDEILATADLSNSKGIVWVDARSRESYEQGHVPRAFLLNDEEWSQEVDSIVAQCDNATEVIVYCSKGCRTSYKIAERLKEQGVVVPIRILKGGYEAWLRTQKLAK